MRPLAWFGYFVVFLGVSHTRHDFDSGLILRLILILTPLTTCAGRSPQSWIVPRSLVLSTYPHMSGTLLPPALHQIPREAYGTILCYLASGFFLYALVLNDVGIYVQCALVIYAQIFMILFALDFKGREAQ